MRIVGWLLMLVALLAVVAAILTSDVWLFWGAMIPLAIGGYIVNEVGVK